jgi:formate hydrogenlyase subunit 4
VATLHLPWFGSPGDPTVQQFSAVSGELWRTGIVPASQGWGYLIAAWSVLLVVLALLAAIVCVLRSPRNRSPMGGLLLCIAVASVLLVALVLAELTSRAQFDLVSYAHADWGAWISLGLALVSSAGAWLAWASWRFPHLWGFEASTD